MTFRVKLLLSMVLLVIGITATALFITGNQVRLSYERHFQESFHLQVESFLQQRAARLEPVKDRVSAAAAGTRLIAPMENVDQEHVEQSDIDDLYQNGLDQLSELIAALPGSRNNQSKGFFFLFLNNRGEILLPSDQLKLPFSLAGLGRNARQLAAIGSAVRNQSGAQVGYLAIRDQTGSPQIREMVFTPIVDQVSRQQLGVLGAGFPLPHASSAGLIVSALWVDDRLYSSSIPTNELAQFDQVIGAELKRRAAPQHNFAIRLGDAAYQVYCQALSAGAGFPPAYQVCLYSLAEAAAEKQRFIRRILVSASIASIFAILLSWLISRSLAVPLQELVIRTAQIERGDYTAKVAVRGRDELSKLGLAFNAMAERVQSTHAALEERIAERTHELEERKRAEAALRKSEASLREAQRIAHLGNWEWHVPSNALHWSDEIYSIFGLTPRQFGATYESFLERVLPADQEKVQNGVRESIQSGKPYALEHRVIRPDGEVRTVREQAEVFRDALGKAIRMVGTVQDVTEQKKIEAEFLRAQRMDSIGAIAGGMAHDLNNALAPILMGIQLIRKKVSIPELRQMLDVMETNTHRGAEMVRQVLTFARGREGEQEVLELGGLVHEMENILRQTMPKSISVQVLVANDLWRVVGNATQLHQALLNLCVNARDAMPQGGRLILVADNVELTDADTKDIQGSRPGCFVNLMVSDSGTGIPPDMLPRIFEAFYTTKPPGKGTGLGLSTIVRIVRNHGGFLSVKSEVGSGTTFELFLPKAETDLGRALTPEADTKVAARGRGELIVFVDDDRSVREMVSPTLIENGYRVITAANGAEALALIEQHKAEVRLVITDVVMPVMGGLDIAQTLSASRPDLPIVLMSGTYEIDSASVPPGLAGALRKPFRVEQLLGAISGALAPSRPG